MLCGILMCVCACGIAVCGCVVCPMRSICKVCVMCTGVHSGQRMNIYVPEVSQLKSTSLTVDSRVG